MANLNEFLEGDEELTRSKGGVSVKEIYPVKYSTVATRSEQKETGCENLIYVANFEDNAGYAVLAADERIPDKVIAITEGRQHGPRHSEQNSIIHESGKSYILRISYHWSRILLQSQNMAMNFL